MITNLNEYIVKYNLKSPILRLENIDNTIKMSSTNTDTMRLRTRTSTRKISDESLQSEILLEKPKRRKSSDPANPQAKRSTQRSKSSRNRSNSRSRTNKTNAPKLYTKKDLDISPVKTRSRRKTVPKTSEIETSNDPDIIEIETIKTSFASCEYDIVEAKSQEPIESVNSNQNENVSSEHRFEDDELEDTKNREKNLNQTEIVKDTKGCTYYNAGYLRFTTCKILRMFLATLMFLVILTFLNNIYKFESLNNLSVKWPTVRSVQKNIDQSINTVTNFILELF